MKLRRFWFGLIICLIGISSIILFITVQIEEDKEMKAYTYDVFHRCESIADWIASDCDIAIDSTQKVEGRYSIKMTADDNTVSTIRYDRNVDWSNFEDIVFWVYHAGYTNEIGRLYLWTDAVNYYYWEFDFAASWTEVVIDLSSTPDGSVGELDLSNINWINVAQWNMTFPGEDYYFDFFHSRTIEVSAYMNDCRIHDAILPAKKRFTFTCHPNYKSYFNEENYIDIFDDTPTLRFSGWIKTKSQNARGIYEFSCPGLANEAHERTYDKSFTTDNTKEKLQDITTNGLRFCTEGTYDATATDWSYEFNRACIYMLNLARWMERQVPYIKPDGEIMVKKYNVLTASGKSWTLGDGNQQVQLIDIPELKERTPGYYKGNTGITSVPVRYINNTPIVRPATPTEIAKTKSLKEFRDPKIQELATAQQIGDNLYAIFSLDTEFIGLRGEGLGWLQPGETVEIENTRQITIAKAHRLLQRVIYDPKNDIHHLMIFSNNIITPREFKSEFDTSGQQIHTAVLQSMENQANLDKFIWRTPEKVADDWDFTALGAVSTVELDFSAIVPAGATTAYMKVWIEDDGLNHVYTRHTSQVSTFQIDMFRVTVINQWDNKIMICPLDSNYKCDFNSSTNFNNWTTLTGVVVGWDV